MRNSTIVYKDLFALIGRAVGVAALRGTLCDFARARKRPPEATGAAAKATKAPQAITENAVFSGGGGAEKRPLIILKLAAGIK